MALTSALPPCHRRFTLVTSGMDLSCRRQKGLHVLARGRRKGLPQISCIRCSHAATERGFLAAWALHCCSLVPARSAATLSRLEALHERDGTKSTVPIEQCNADGEIIKDGRSRGKA